MTGRDPMEYGWWLASRASGLVALALITFSVLLGLAMAGKAVRRPGLPRTLGALHEHLALAGLIAIAVHGITLLGDGWLNPGPIGISVPFAMEYRPLWTGLGIAGGYLAAALGLSFYARKRIGARRWRQLHKLTILVYVLSVAHTLGAGSDASTPWLRTLLVLTGAPVLFLFVMRILPREKARVAVATRPPGGGAAAPRESAPYPAPPHSALSRP
jgi:sulfoxide reductase heme-binding subunit YedZ